MVNMGPKLLQSRQDGAQIAETGPGDRFFLDFGTQKYTPVWTTKRSRIQSKTQLQKRLFYEAGSGLIFSDLGPMLLPK